MSNSPASDARRSITLVLDAAPGRWGLVLAPCGFDLAMDLADVVRREHVLDSVRECGPNGAVITVPRGLAEAADYVLRALRDRSYQVTVTASSACVLRHHGGASKRSKGCHMEAAAWLFQRPDDLGRRPCTRCGKVVELYQLTAEYEALRAG
jgi:hypothetical protein